MNNIDKDEFRKYAVKHHRIGGMHVDKFMAGVNRANMPNGMAPMGYTPYIIE